jgi:hypothetical protein
MTKIASDQTAFSFDVFALPAVKIMPFVCCQDVLVMFWVATSHNLIVGH